MAHSSRSRSDRPAKPYADFPLFPHATRRWAKKIKGKFVFFGPWDDAHGALQRYLAQCDELHAGHVPGRQHGAVRHRSPARARVGMSAAHVAETDESTNVLNAEEEFRPAKASAEGRRQAAMTAVNADGGLSIRDLVNHFPTTKKRRLDAEEMGLRSFSEYHATAGRLVKFLGKHRLVADHPAARDRTTITSTNHGRS